MAYRPLANGRLTMKQDAIVLQLAAKYQKTSAQIALNWLLSQNIVAIPKASSPEHLLENWGAQGWQLVREDVQRLSVYK